MAVWSEWEGVGMRQDFGKVVTYEDLVDSGTHLLNHPNFDRVRFLLANFSATQQVSVDPARMEMVLATNAVSLRYKREFIVLIVGTHPGIHDLYFAFLDRFFGTGWEYLLMDNLQQAREFLEKATVPSAPATAKKLAVDWVRRRERSGPSRGSSRRLRFRW